MKKAAKAAGLLLVFSLSLLSTSLAGTIDTVVGNYDPNGLPATAVNVTSSDVAVDSSGNLYIPDPSGFVYKVDTSGAIFIFAGTGFSGSSGDGGPATDAYLLRPTDVAINDSGNVYIVDPTASRIRKVDPQGTITTFAGNGKWGFSGDGGPATDTRLNNPQKIAFDSAQNLYIADRDNHRIRRVDSGGTITTVAGNGSADFSGDHGPATAASLNLPNGVAIDAAGNIYIADYGNHRIRKIDLSGTITTIAGNGTAGHSGDGGPATAARLNNPRDVAIDANGSLYIADYRNNRIRKVSPAGTITEVYAISFPFGIEFDSADNLYIPDLGRINRMRPDGTVDTVAGTGDWHSFFGDGGPAVAARLDRPQGLTADAFGNLYIADTFNHRIRKVDANGTISTVAGREAGGFGGDGGPATDAKLVWPRGVEADDGGILYIADTGNNRVRRVDLEGTITTVAGNGTGAFSGDGGPATDAGLYAPFALAFDVAGNLYIADSANQRIRKVDSSGTITTVAGNGVRGFSGDGGPAIAASLAFPFGITVDNSGNLYIADRLNRRIRKVDVNGTMTTIAGTGFWGHGGDGGPAIDASLAEPRDVAFDVYGNLYFTDSNYSRIRRVDPGGTIYTVAGHQVSGFGGDGGPATSASMNQPFGLAFDVTGNLHFTDTGNHRVRRFFPSLPPVCEATLPAAVECTGSTTAIDLDGSAASDPDGDPIAFSWTTDCPAPSFDDATSAMTTLTFESAAPGVCGPSECTATLTVTDDSGLANTCAPIPIRVADTTAPVIALESTTALILECSIDAFTDPGDLATDACDPDVALVIGGATVDPSTLGDYLVTYAAADACGNDAAAVTRTVTVADTTAPVIALEGEAELTLECSVDTFADPGAAAADVCDPNVDVTAGGATVDPATVGEYLITYDAVDASGNDAATASRAVTVADSTAPVVALEGDTAMTLECSVDSFTEPGASASDLCDPDLAVVIAGDTVDPTTVGEYLLTYDALDASGNDAATAVRAVTVADSTAPVVALEGDAAMTLECSVDSFTDPGAMAADACDPNVDVTVGGATVDPATVGEYLLSYDAVDASGNDAATASRAVTVADTTAPVIALEGDAALNLECAIDTFVDPGATATDACDPNVDVVVGGATVDPAMVGEYLITYEAADSSGNAAMQALRTVTVADTLAPAIQQLAASPAQLWPPNHRMVEVTVSALAADACDGAPACAIVAVTSDEPVDGTGDGDTAPDWQIVDGSTVLLRAERAGGGDGRVYTVSVSCTDAAGNAAAGEVRVSVPHRRGR